jgi:hypothetical protein
MQRTVLLKGFLELNIFNPKWSALNAFGAAEKTLLFFTFLWLKFLSRKSLEEGGGWETDFFKVFTELCKHFHDYTNNLHN